MWLNWNINVNTQETSLKGGIMKIKLKNPQALPNAWKGCGMTKEEWKDLEAGNTVEVKSLPELIKDNVDVVGSASKKKGDK